MEDFYIDYSHLDDYQRAYIDRVNNRHMVVIGSAGSGKTLIALHKLRQVSTQGSYAIIVYTKSLKKYFVDGVNAMIRDMQDNHGESINLRTDMIFYFKEWEKWRRSHQSDKVDYLIIDECQDFSRDQLNAMYTFGRICLYFGDPDQAIMDFEYETKDPAYIAERLQITPDILYKNYRLTIETAKVVEIVPRPIVDTEISDSCVRHGEKPRLVKADSFDKQLDKIISIINNRALTNVGILLRYNHKGTAYSRSGAEWRSVQYVKEYFENKGITVEFKYNINKDTEMDLDFKSSNPKILTWWCAKGLQFKDVFVLDCDYDYINTGQTDRDKRRLASAWYVALSRTSERLYICYSGALASRFPLTTSDLYIIPETAVSHNTDYSDLPF